MSDEWAGHPPEEHVSIFEKFHRLDAGDVRKPMGTGWASTYLAAWWKLWVGGSGSRVSLSWRHLSHRPAACCNTRMSELVLVIDDDATLLGLLAEHLSRASYHITAVSGTGAADILRTTILISSSWTS